MAEYGIRLEKRGKIAVVVIDRPGRQNAFDELMFDSLEKTTAQLTQKPPRAVIITGQGTRAFSAGFDVNPDNPLVSNLMGAVTAHDEGPARIIIDRVRKAVDGFVSVQIPLIAAINGLAYGGGAEMAVRCDLRVMDPGAVICFSEVRLGLMPDWGGGATLARLIGPSKAADLILTAREVGAEEALGLGLVNRISPPGRALDEAVKMAEMIAKNGPLAVKHALKLIRRSTNLSLTEALELEAEKAVSLIATGECFHGVRAFLEKREPDFPDPE